MAGFRDRNSPAARPVSLALPARPELFIEFYFGAPVLATTSRGTAFAPSTVLVGPSTAHHTDLHFDGAIDTFTIKLQPTALHRLFGMAGRLLVDQAEEAGLVDAGFAALRRSLEGVPEFAGRVALAEDWLRRRAASAREVSPIDHAARLIRRSGGQVDLDRLADRCGMGARHFRRCFGAAVGLPPKFYSRIVRFHAALQVKDRHPTSTWTEVAHRLGYFDQSHFLRDARVFAGDMPLPRYAPTPVWREGAVAGFSYSAR
ncbi:helix-turn-helix domain-containing protein [Sphingomonas azotifigens]|uniref:helix-turn-helix domain-containing protein n=1 Tax=Sphingomonas azotifigens TaxID=330920 RepID=UPI00111C8B43|nr:helix-turn-helix domain-containing protein [Sphingomonas azotifigens]